MPNKDGDLTILGDFMGLAAFPIYGVFGKHYESPPGQDTVDETYLLII
jgi:hypothetical protein